MSKLGNTYVGWNAFWASSLLNLIMAGNINTMFRPSSMMGAWQYAQLTLQGRS